MSWIVSSMWIEYASCCSFVLCNLAMWIYSISPSITALREATFAVCHFVGRHAQVHDNIPVCFTDECRLAITRAKAFACVHSYAVGHATHVSFKLAVFARKKGNHAGFVKIEKSSTCIIKIYKGRSLMIIGYHYIGLFGLLETSWNWTSLNHWHAAWGIGSRTSAGLAWNKAVSLRLGGAMPLRPVPGDFVWDEMLGIAWIWLGDVWWCWVQDGQLGEGACRKRMRRDIEKDWR